MPVSKLAGRQYNGYPAWIFVEVFEYGRGSQTYCEQLTILDKWYSHLRAFLPVLFEKDLQLYNDDYAPMLESINNKLKHAWQLYDPIMEPEQTCNMMEKEFILHLREIFIDLDELTAITKIIDRQKFTEGFEAA